MGKVIMTKAWTYNEDYELVQVTVPKGKMNKTDGFNYFGSSIEETFGHMINNQKYILSNEQYKVKKREELIAKLFDNYNETQREHNKSNE